MVQNEPRSMSLEGFPDLTGFVRFCPDFADFADFADLTGFDRTNPVFLFLVL